MGFQGLFFLFWYLLSFPFFFLNEGKEGNRVMMEPERKVNKREEREERDTK